MRPCFLAKTRTRLLREKYADHESNAGLGVAANSNLKVPINACHIDLFASAQTLWFCYLLGSGVEWGGTNPSHRVPQNCEYATINATQPMSNVERDEFELEFYCE